MRPRRPCGCAGRLTEAGALAKAREILGPRALVWTEDRVLVVGRAERSFAGSRERRAYGKGASWAVALRRAAESYAKMRAEAGRGR